jgi:hypothetical protein
LVPNTLDIRGTSSRISSTSAPSAGQVGAGQFRAEADADATSEQAASVATTACVCAMRADVDLRVRQADTLLATDLLRIAQSQLQAERGRSDVTRARRSSLQPARP